MKNDTRQHNPFFRYLRQLKAGGRTNMYGAVPYLMRTFGLDRERAFAIVCQWLDQQAGPDSAGSAERKLSPAKSA